jgi:ribosomal peptide maturation radical SAM protein 1
MAGIEKPRVLFLDMPWATGQRPSIALAILRQLCVENNVPVQVFYSNLDMATRVGFEVAGRFADERQLYGLSEHLFSVDVFGKEALQSDEYLQILSEGYQNESKRDPWKTRFADLNFLKHLRDEEVPQFLDKVLERVLDANPDIVGFTATFNQVMSSIALASRIKKVRPEIQILMGGACFDGEMGQEYHRALPHIIDHVFMGEAEESFRAYLKRVKAGEPTDGIPGVTSVINGELLLIPGRPLANMNESPSPDYDDFFSEKERLLKETGRVFNIEFIPFESSRGCWWGAKNHCVFCGINPELMGFRAKDVDRVIREIVTLSARYGVVRLTATDWIISRWHCNELFRRLKELDLDLEIFYEVRADMKKWQIKLMREAGVAMIQPGIESFSTPLLQLMKKGTMAIRHVQFLRWCKEYGIDASYNILACFPGEQAEWYFEMARLIPHLRHLQPPINNIVPIEMHRFAPLYEKKESFGVETHMIRPDYAFNLPAGLADPQKIAYFFSFRSNRIPPAGDYMKTMEVLIDSWQTAHRQKQPPLYEYMIGAGFLRVTDTRQGEGRYLHLADLHQDVVLLCDEISSRRTLAADLSARYPREVANGTLDRVIDELVAADVLMAEGNYLLTLPIGRRPRTTEELRSYVLGKTEVPQEAPAQAQPA